jgi:large subunit ribosomal protein L13
VLHCSLFAKKNNNKFAFVFLENNCTFAPRLSGLKYLINKIISVDTLSYKTISANKATVNKQWLLVDAEGETLGRLASKVAKLLRGKHKPNFTPHVDCGDNVVIINAEKIYLSGNKWESKTYSRYTGYPGGQRTSTVKQVLDKNPERIVEKAIKGMLPKNKLGADLFRNLKVNVGPSHDQEAQKPTVINLKDLK